MQTKLQTELSESIKSSANFHAYVEGVLRECVTWIRKDIFFKAFPEVTGPSVLAQDPMLELLSSILLALPLLLLTNGFVTPKLRKTRCFVCCSVFQWQVKSMFKQHQCNWEIISVTWSMRSYDLGSFQDFEWISIFGDLHLLDYPQINLLFFFHK